MSKEQYSEFFKYSHISFDLWLTLIKSNPEFKLKRNLLFKDYFKIDHSIDDISEVIRYYDINVNQMNEITGSNIDTFEIYLLILNRFDIKTEKASLEDFYEKTERLFFEFPPVLLDFFSIDFFKELKRNNISSSILSNTGFIKGKTLRKLIKKLALNDFFDFQLYSDEENLSKPNPLLFAKIMNYFEKDFPKNKILHVGDNKIADYQGALDFGFKAKLLQNE